MYNKFFAAAALSSLMLAAAPAMAQTDDAPRLITGYGTLGYSHYDQDGAGLGAATGRLGLRYGRFLGAEAEGSFSVKDDQTLKFGQPFSTELKRSVAAYAVGYAPVLPKLDLFARIGFGNTKIETSTPTLDLRTQRDSVNYGGGAQYFLTAWDGLRADYTRQSYTGGPGHADVWGVSYVRKF